LSFFEEPNFNATKRVRGQKAKALDTQSTIPRWQSHYKVGPQCYRSAEGVQGKITECYVGMLTMLQDNYDLHAALCGHATLEAPGVGDASRRIRGL
jgi:hypothetical protein